MHLITYSETGNIIISVMLVEFKELNSIKEELKEARSVIKERIKHTLPQELKTDETQTQVCRHC